MARDRRRLPPAAGLTSEERFAQEDFARRLHQLLAEKGMSQSDLARKIWGEKQKVIGGVPQITKDGEPQMEARNRDRISVYLKGDGFPDPKNLSAISKALGVKPEDLAPEIVGAAVERETPEQSMVTVAGHHDKVLLRFNKLVSLDVALKALNVINGVEKP